MDFCENFILNSFKKNILRNEAFGDSKASRKKIAIIYSTEEVTAKRQAFVQSYWSGMPIEDIPFIIIVGIGKLLGVKSFITLYNINYIVLIMHFLLNSKSFQHPINSTMP